MHTISAVATDWKALPLQATLFDLYNSEILHFQWYSTTIPKGSSIAYQTKIWLTYKRCIMKISLNKTQFEDATQKIPNLLISCLHFLHDVYSSSQKIQESVILTRAFCIYSISKMEEGCRMNDSIHLKPKIGYWKGKTL